MGDAGFAVPGLSWPEVGLSNLDDLLPAAEELGDIEREQKEVRYSSGAAPGTNFIASMWVNRFQAFRKKTLAVDINSAPTADQLDKFILVVPRLINGQGDTGLPSFDYVLNGLQEIQKWTRLTFGRLEFDKDEKRKFNITMEYLVDQNKLTREAKRNDHKYLTTDDMKVLIEALLRDGLENGTLSWDALIMKSVSLLLQAVLASRAGAVHLSHLFDEYESMRWEHITVCLDNRDGREFFIATVEMYFEKGWRTNRDRLPAVEVTEFSNPDHNCLCPLKLLLVHALRVGAVAETSWIELRDAARARSSKRVVWAHPTRPVICAMEQSKKLQLDRPSTVQSAGFTIEEAAQKAGVIGRLRTHDIRRGAAVEAAHLLQHRSASVEAARVTLNHSHHALHDGTTESYVSHLRDDQWRTRVEGSVPRSAKHSLDYAPEPYRKRQRTKEELDELCRSMDVDPDNATDRARVSWTAREKDYDAWIEIQRARALMVQNPVQATRAQVTEDGTDVATNAVASDADAILHAHPDEFVKYFSTINEYYMDAENGHDVLPVAVERGNSRNPPTRRTFRCTVVGCDREFFRIPQRDRHSKTCDATLRQTYDFACSECNKKFATEKQLKSHEQDHRWTPRTCTWPGCDDQTIFRTLNEAKVHNAIVHRQLPTVCFVDGCQTEVTTPANLKAHIRAQHPEITEAELALVLPNQKREAHKKNSFKPQRCSFPGCSSVQVFGERKQYGYHLRSHKVKKDTLDRYIIDNPPDLQPTIPPRVLAALYTPQKCHYPGCTSIQKYMKRYRLVTHLNEVHGVREYEQIQAIIQSNPID